MNIQEKQQNFGDTPNKEKIETLIKVINQDNLLNSIPIPTFILNKNYQKYVKKLPKEDQSDLCVVQYAKTQKKSLDSVYLELIQTEYFQFLLINKLKFDIESIKHSGLVLDQKAYISNLNQQVEDSYLKYIDEQLLHFISLQQIEDKILEEFQQKFTQINKPINSIKKLIKGIIIQNKGIICNLASSQKMVFSLQKLQSTYPIRKDDYCQIISQSINQKCNIDIPLHQNLKEDKEYCILSYDQFSHLINLQKEEIKKEIDFNKIIIIDSFDLLNKHREYISTSSIIGVDIEGRFEIGGGVNLIQFQCKDKIFIFDSFGTKCGIKDIFDKKDQSGQLFIKMHQFIKTILEDSSICKIFHDCRKDSYGLHLFGNSCLKNIFDTSAVHSFNQHLMKCKEEHSNIYRMPKSSTNIKLNLQEEIKVNSDGDQRGSLMSSINKIEEDQANTIVLNFEKIGPPGINKVLQFYNASHGYNRVKNIFEKVPEEYYHIRPLPLEWILYAASDVEDLIQVKEKMIESIKMNLEDLGTSYDLKYQDIELLCKELSLQYAQYGCNKCSE